MGGNVRSISECKLREASIVSAQGTEVPLSPRPGPMRYVRTLRVLTLTPFYPSRENPTEGCFVAEVLPWTQQLEIKNAVIAVRPFYRGTVRALVTEIPCAWKTYFSFPGNPGLSSAGSFLGGTLNRILRNTQSEKPFDLIHAHAALPCGHAALLASRKLGIPFVVTAHGLDVFFDRQANGTIGAWCRRVSEQVFREARAVVCISERVQDQLTDSTANTKVIHNGVDTSLFSPGAQQNSPPVVLCIGNLIPTKGHALLVRAFADIARQISDCELEIIGDGPERRALTILVQSLGLSNRVRFLGNQTREAVAGAMKRCAVFALPSSYEGLGSVYLEAMACGKPAIGCEGQGIADVIQHGNNGLLVPPGAETQLRDALLMLTQNEGLRQRLGSAARQTILRRHTLAHQAARLAELYRECVA